MPKIDEAKPVSGGYDFGDDWLGDLEEALEFDGQGDEAACACDEKEDAGDVGAVLVGDVEVLDVGEESAAAGEDAYVDVSSAASQKEEGKEGKDEDYGGESASKAGVGPVLAQVLDIGDLQKTLKARVPQPVEEMQACEALEGKSLLDKSLEHDSQLWQFASLIVMRLFDDLELMIIDGQSAEACDFMKQLNRLANILAFAGLGEQLPLLAYIGGMMPVSFTDADIGEPTVRQYDALKMRSFMENANEVLNCLVYVMSYMQHRAPVFDSHRFTSVLKKLYEKLGATPGEPGAEAPLPSMDSVNPQELTTRTIGKLARTLEALITESLHYLESCVFYGYSKGYADASKSLDSALQISREYRLTDLEGALKEIYLLLQGVRLPQVPGNEVYEKYFAVCDMLERHFSKPLPEKKLKHLRMLIMKFKKGAGRAGESESFGARWKRFIKDAAPELEFERCDCEHLHQRLEALHEAAKRHAISWLSDTFEHLLVLWPAYTGACADAFIALASELRSFPTEDIEPSDVSQLNHERLLVLFGRRPESRPVSAYTLVNDARSLSESLMQELSGGRLVSSHAIYDLLIDARRIECHAIVRTCEILVSLYERASIREDKTLVSDSVVDALYFTTGLLQTVCEFLMRYLEKDPDTQAVYSGQIFYSALMSLYRAPGKPRDGVIGFIIRQVNDILGELQLVWANPSTSTSTEFYCSLVRKLLHLANICELQDLRQLLVEHLDDIATSDFMNTENRTMQRQCVRIVRAVQECCPRLNVVPSSRQVLTFFSRAIAALNQLLSAPDADDSQSLLSEVSRLGMHLSILSMTTDFPPAIAFIFELRQMSYQPSLDRHAVEDLLYEMITVANNVCPEWQQSKEAELDFVKTSAPIPMSLFHEILEGVDVVYEALKARQSEEPVAWERIKQIHRSLGNLLGYLPYTLQTLVVNAQNRCRYLKKNIYIDLDTSGYPDENESEFEEGVSAAVAGFAAIVDELLKLIIDYAFLSTDGSSRINLVLQPFKNEISVSIVHNGRLFTVNELMDRLEKVGIVPARDENLFDLVVGSRRMFVSYPPANRLAYILPILRQFNGELELSSDAQNRTRLYLSIKL